IAVLISNRRFCARELKHLPEVALLKGYARHDYGCLATRFDEEQAVHVRLYDQGQAGVRWVRIRCITTRRTICRRRSRYERHTRERQRLDSLACNRLGCHFESEITDGFN
ncbi:MAG: hypothetical protein ACREYC_03380, partial [Gammaproteobacteria bacterium]